MLYRTQDGVRIHRSIRGVPARRVLIIGHLAIDKSAGHRSDLFHLDVGEARVLRHVLDEFINLVEKRGEPAPHCNGDEDDRHAYREGVDDTIFMLIPSPPPKAAWERSVDRTVAQVMEELEEERRGCW